MAKAAKDGEKETPNPVGRPPLFKTANDLQKKIDGYFASLEGEWDSDEGKWIKPPKRSTITGLCLFLGFNSRQTFLNYMENGEFVDMLSRARTMVEESYEMHLYEKSSNGAQFALMNMGWSANKKVEHSGDPDRPVTITGMRIINE